MHVLVLDTSKLADRKKVEELKKTLILPTMMPTAEGMSHMIPCHVLRVGQTIRLHSSQDNVPQPPGLSMPKCQVDDPDLDMTLENLNQLMLELDPTFEPIQVNKSPTCTSPPTGSFSDGSRCQPCDRRPSLTKQGRLQELHNRGTNSSPASLAGSHMDIPLLLINGAPQSDLHISGSEADLMQKIPTSPSRRKCFQASFSGSQPSMKFVMDTSKFWFRPHISRAEGRVALKLVLRTMM
ncbi:hypothetical protein XENOCAPTIV_007799 [Xenoophorus captivus]|uniref:Uncharacterized protein n=1 Tax=Xenoophorus captivus TaxID=1517983 RepID=A0ABV0RZC5_9TELE